MDEQLPLRDWEEGSTVKVADGRRLVRWGSVAQAGRILWDYKKDTIYALIKAEEFKAVKRGGGRTCNWRVDLVSVWEYKMRVENGDSMRL